MNNEESKYGVPNEKGYVWNPILGMTTVNLIKEAEADDLIVAEFSREKWYWKVTKKYIQLKNQGRTFDAVIKPPDSFAEDIDLKELPF